MTDHPSFPDGFASLSQAKPQSDASCTEADATSPPSSQGPRDTRDGGTACIAIGETSGKNRSWHTLLWGTPSNGCMVLPDLAAGAVRRSLVILSEGAGLAPMTAITRLLMDQQEHLLDIHFIHESQNACESAYLPDLYAWNLSPHFSLHLLQSSARSPLHAHMSHGEVDIPFLRGIPLPRVADYYVCGSHGFTERARAALSTLGVGEGNIHVASISPTPAAPSFGAPAVKKLAYLAEAVQQKQIARRERAARQQYGFLAFMMAPTAPSRRLRRS